MVETVVKISLSVQFEKKTSPDKHKRAFIGSEARGLGRYTAVQGRAVLQDIRVLSTATAWTVVTINTAWLQLLPCIIRLRSAYTYYTWWSFFNKNVKVVL
jgi:hypothetical protein